MSRSQKIIFVVLPKKNFNIIHVHYLCMFFFFLRITQVSVQGSCHICSIFNWGSYQQSDEEVQFQFISFMSVRPTGVKVRNGKLAR